uniref:zinc-binding dehydrogenase n=1 Tax=uncultured Frigoribacterium sp. TaxID=335377 RepID=UPI0028D577ED
ARARGAARVTVVDVLPEPLARALAVGADEVLRLGEDAVPADSFDVVLECSGAAPAVSAAFVAARRLGVVAQVGMVPDVARPVNLAPAISKELTVLGVFRFRDEIDEAVRMLDADRSLGAVVTHVVDSADAARAFDVARDSSVSGKVLVAAWPDRP